VNCSGNVNCGVWLPSLSLSFLLFFPPFNRGLRVSLQENFFGNKGTHRRVLEHFRHRNQHLREPGFWSKTFKFHIGWAASSFAYATVLNRHLNRVDDTH